MIVTTTPSVEGHNIVEYKGIVFGEVIAGEGIEQGMALNASGRQHDVIVVAVLFQNLHVLQWGAMCAIFVDGLQHCFCHGASPPSFRVVTYTLRS